MTACLKKRTGKKKNKKALWCLWSEGKKEIARKKILSLIHSFHIWALCQALGWALRLNGRVALGIHGLMREAREDCGGLGAAMQLTAFSVGARRASCGRCHATKHGEARMGIAMEGGPPLQGRGCRDNDHSKGGVGALKSNPVFVKPWHSNQGCLSAFF